MMVLTTTRAAMKGGTFLPRTLYRKMLHYGFLLIISNAIWSGTIFQGVQAKAENYVDLIKEFGLPDLPPGIQAAPGICGDERNAYQTHKSPAYSITKDAILTVQTSSVFPDGFPSDFSIVLALRNERSNQTKAPIFTIYSDESEEVLSLSIGPEIKLSYEQIDAGFNQHNAINFGIGIDDQKWHRIGLSVKGTSATLNLDCTKQVTRRVERSMGSTISTNGLILTGVQMSNDDGFFIGDVQMMAIFDTPQAGYDVCMKYVPECRGGYGDDGFGELANELLMSGPGYIHSSSSSSFSLGGGGVGGRGGVTGGESFYTSTGGVNGAGGPQIISSSIGGNTQVFGGGSLGTGGNPNMATFGGENRQISGGGSVGTSGGQNFIDIEGGDALLGPVLNQPTLIGTGSGIQGSH